MSKKYFELAFELSGKTNNSLGSAFKGLKVDVDSLNKKIANLEKTRGDVKRFDGLRKDILKTNREFNEAQKKVKELSKEMKNTTNPSQKLQNEFQKSQKEVSNLSNKLEKQKDELRQLKGSMSEAGISTKNFAKDQANLEKTLNRTIKAQAAYNTSKSNLEAAKAQTAAARGKLVDAVAMGATLVVPAKLAMDAEEAMADINKVADFDSDKELKDMEKKIMEMNTKGKIPMSFNELGQIVASGAQAGINKLELPDFARDAAKMGIAMDIEAEEAGQLMAGWRSAFDMNQKEVINLADKVNYLGNTTAASAPLISDFVTRVGALGEVGGVQSGEIAALGATLIGMNIPAEVAATATNKLISTLNKGSSATKKQQKVFKKLGFNATDMAKRMQTDAKGAIVDVMKAMDKLPDYEKAAALNELFGETGTKAVAPLLNNIRQLEENLEKVNETQKLFTGSMESEFETRVNTSSNSMQLLKNQMNNMGITLGSVLLPPIVQLSTIAGVAANKVQEFADKYPNLTKWIVIATATFLALNVALIAGVYAARLLKESYLSVGHGINKLRKYWVDGKIQAIGHAIATKAMSAAQLVQAGVSKLAATGQWLVNKALLAFPGTWIIAAIVAVIATAVLLVKHWDKVKETLGKLWGMFAEKFPGMAAFAENAARVIKDTFGKAIGWVSGKVELLGNAWQNVKDKLSKNKGGSAVAANLPAYAKGGIVSTPQIALVGEGGASEAIIPLEKTANSMSLWEKAGRALGVDMSPKGIDIAAKSSGGKGFTTNNNSGVEKYEFNFSIDAKGAAPGIEELIKEKLLLEVIPIIMRLLDEKQRDKIRVSMS